MFSAAETEKRLPPHGRQESIRIERLPDFLTAEYESAFIQFHLIVRIHVFEGSEADSEALLNVIDTACEGEFKNAQEMLEKEWMKHVTGHDLIKFGIIPELIGRLPVITALSDLSEDDLVRVLTEPKNSLISQYKHLFKLDNVELLFEKEALYAIAKKAKEQNTGARGLRGIIEGLLTDLMFETPSDVSIEKILITRDVVEKGAKPQIIRNGAADFALKLDTGNSKNPAS